PVALVGGCADVRGDAHRLLERADLPALSASSAGAAALDARHRRDADRVCLPRDRFADAGGHGVASRRRAALPRVARPPRAELERAGGGGYPPPRPSPARAKDRLSHLPPPLGEGR